MDWGWKGRESFESWKDLSRKNGIFVEKRVFFWKIGIISVKRLVFEWEIRWDMEKGRFEM